MSLHASPTISPSLACTNAHPHPTTHALSPLSLSLPSPLSRYTVSGEKIHSSALVLVAKGTKKNTKHVFAIKSYKIARTDDRHRRLLDKEVLALKTVDHPNICRLFETYEDRFDVHLVYVICGSLGTLRSLHHHIPPPVCGTLLVYEDV